MYFLLITCIIPSNFEGWGKAALLLDTDGTFQLGRFQRLLLARVTRLLSLNNDPDDIAQRIVKAALGNLHIFCPTSSVQLAATLAHLPAYHSKHLRNTEIGLLAVDSMSAFYWPDRFTVEQLRSIPMHSRPGTAVNVANPLHHVLVALQNFRLSHNPVTVLTNWGLNPVPNSSFYRQHLHPFPSPFPESQAPASGNLPSTSLPLTHHITLNSVPIPSLDNEMAPADEQYRKEFCFKGEVRGLVRTPGSSDVGHFVFYIGANDISS